jgi:hypothetical protein
MNIFNVLSEGKSRLHEPSISAMLGYLLGTTHDHGLGDRFFREFLNLINTQHNSPILEKILAQPFIKTEIELEAAYEHPEGKRCDIDIVISLPDNKSFTFFIENKIRYGSAKENQLSEYYSAILDDAEQHDIPFMIFITPEENKEHYKEQFDRLKVKSNHYKTWIFWRSQNGGILNTLVNVLEKEAIGEINPINECLRHTIKAFVSHIRARLLTQEINNRASGEDIGQIIEEIFHTTKDGTTYRIVLRNSTQIQVYHKDEKLVAKQVLRKIIEDSSLNIPTKGINTRTMGKKVIQSLKNKSDA